MLGTSGSISLRLEGATLYKALLSGGLTLTAFGLWKLVSFIVRIYTSPLRILPGPTNKSWIYGNLEEIRKADVSEMHEKWAEEYGKILVYKAFFCVSTPEVAILRPMIWLLNVLVYRYLT